MQGQVFMGGDLCELVIAGDGMGFRVEEQADAQVQLPHRLRVRKAPASCDTPGLFKGHGGEHAKWRGSARASARCLLRMALMNN